MSANPVLTLLLGSHCEVLSPVTDALDNIASRCSEVISVTDKRIIFGNIKEIVAVHQELADTLASNSKASFASLGSILSSFLFFSNFISAHVDYAKTRSQSASTLRHLGQANKKFSSLIEGSKGTIRSTIHLEGALDSPLNFVSRLRAVISKAGSDSGWNSQESKTWNGIEKNLQRICRDEEDEAQKRGLENKLFQLELRILELPDKIHRKGRYLIDQLTLFVSYGPRALTTSPNQITKVGSHPSLKSKFSELVVVLINDLLLLLKRSKSQKGMFVFKQQQDLTQLLQAELLNLPNAQDPQLKLTFPEHVFILKFESQAAAEKWYLETLEHVPNSGARTDRSPEAGAEIKQSNPASRLSSASTSEASPLDRVDRRTDKYSSDREDPETKKRKKRSTSTNQDGPKISSVGGVPKLQFSPPTTSSSSTQAGSEKKRTSTSSKRSNFTKSHSVATITTEIAPRSLPKLRLTKRPTDRASGESAEFAPLVSDTHEDTPYKKRRTEEAPKSPGKTSAETSPLEWIDDRHGDLPVRSASVTSTKTSEPPKNKYVLHPAFQRKGSGHLDNSSDYEESEDEPARSVSPSAATGEAQGFFKPLPRGLTAARSIESKSLRELRSGSVDDLSARDPPAAAETETSSPSSLRPSLSATSVQQVGTSQTDESSLLPPHNGGCTKPLDVELIVSTIRRMESDLAILKRLLADRGISC